jgi:hypothetical protein
MRETTLVQSSTFVNTLKKFLVEHNYDKVIVFWDAEDNSTVDEETYSNNTKEIEKEVLTRQQQISFEWQLSTS